MSDAKANITLVVGASGSGKSLWIKQTLINLPGPRLVFDPMREYGEFGRAVCSTLGQVVKSIREHGAGNYGVIYQPKQIEIEKQFDLLCGIALALPGCSLICEELSLVTKAGYSPPRWREVVTTGRHARLTVIGATQRPALVDKTIFSNATVIRCGRMNAAGDKKTMADALDVSVDELRDLKPLEWVVKDMASGAICRETLTIPGARQGKKARSPK